METQDTAVIGGCISLRNPICGNVGLNNLVSGQMGQVMARDTGTFDHNELINRDLPDQHPISAITGLQEALDSKADLADLSIINCGSATEVI